MGNPVVDSVRAHTPDNSFLSEKGIRDDERYVALLPGSRKQELESILPTMVSLARDFPNTRFILAGIGSSDPSLYEACKGVDNLTLVIDRTYDILAFASAAVVTSGTATLETAIWGVPQVVVYRSNSPISIFIARMVIKVKYISLVNLISGKKIVEELIQWKLTREALKSALTNILDEGEDRAKILKGYKEINEILGSAPVSDTAAKLMVNYLRN